MARISFLSIMIIIASFMIMSNATDVSTESYGYCQSYTVNHAAGLSSTDEAQIIDIIIAACEQATSLQTFVSYVQTNVDAYLGCTCTNSLAMTYYDYYATSYSIYDSWYLGMQVGEIYCVTFVSDLCTYGESLTPRLSTKFENTPKFQEEDLRTLDSSSSLSLNTHNSDSTCNCKTFLVGSTDLSSSEQAEIKSAAQQACSESYSVASYVGNLQAIFEAQNLETNIFSTNGPSSSIIYDQWYISFEVGCYKTLVYPNLADCGSSPNPSSTPSKSPSPSKATTQTPRPSVSPSPSASEGCGTPSCSGHGRCQNNQCICNSFYHGPQCQYEYCPGNCTYRGYCDGTTGECSCYYPYYGCDCSSELLNCTCEHGTCNQLTGQCACDPGWTGTSCNVSSACADNCNNHGRCNSTQQCECFFGWTGEFCNITDTNCTHGCLNGGYCNSNTGTCTCIYPYFGPQCTWLHCGTGGTDLECSGHGKCNYATGSCYCDPGFSGCFCTSYAGSGTPPPARSPPTLPTFLQCGTGGSDQVCSGNGECNHSTGSCYCDPGWQGCYCNQYSGN